MGIEQPRVRCGSVFTWKTESTWRGFTAFPESHFCRVLDLVCPSKVSPFSQGTRGLDSCGGFPSCPFCPVSTLQALSGWRDLTAQSQPRCFSSPMCPCCFPPRYFGGKRTSHPLNLETSKRNQCSGLFLNSTLCPMKNGRTEAAALGPRFRCRGARAGPRCVFLFLWAFCSHLISTMPVTVYPTVWETDMGETCEPTDICMIVDESIWNILLPLQW